MIAGMLPLLYNSVVVVPPPRRPATGDSCLEIMRHLEQRSLPVRALLVPPSVLEQLVQERDGLPQASKLDFVMFTGGPLAPSAGDLLSQVTDICQLIGSTETGPIPGLVPAERKNWTYFEWQPFYRVDMQPKGEGVFELTLKHDPDLRWIRTVSHTMPHLPMWRSSDLYKQHPENANLWRFHGRLDDVIVLSNGEKFNPVTMEAIIQGHPLLAGALYSGHGKFQPALLVEPKAEVAPDMTDSFIDQIWPSVQKANIEAPQHAQIFRHKIGISTRSKPFRRAAKGTVVRSLTLEDYYEEIESLYTVAGTDGSVLPDSFVITAPQDFEVVKKYVQNSLQEHLEQPLTSDDTNFFALGFDSLQTLELAKKFKAGLGSHRQSNGIVTVTPKDIYTNPSVSSLARFLYRLLNSDSDLVNEVRNGDIEREILMRHLADKYSQGLSANGQKEYMTLTTPGPNGVHRKKALSVIVTGTTGSLGTYLLLSLLQEPCVGRVYCLNRGQDARDRQERTFDSIGAGENINHPKMTFLQVDLSQERFGLESSIFLSLLHDVDAIVHNAWKVDFNHTVQSFEGQIAGVRQMIDFARGSHRRPQIIFVSSVSSVGNWAAVHGDARAIPEIPLDDYNVAQRQGYGESKHISERILQVAAENGGPSVSILRVGQIAGPLHGGGCWNKTEWLPSLVRTSQELGLIPDWLPEVDWIPVDLVAHIMVDILLTNTNDNRRIFHLVNPRDKMVRSCIYDSRLV